MLKRLEFTLIELLLVISIIAILACLLLPVMNSAREKSKQIFCVGNIRQIHEMALLYTGDYSDYVLPSRQTVSSYPLAPNDWSYWPTLLVFAGYQSAPNKQWPAVFKCPSTETLTSYGINVQTKYRDGVSAADGTAAWVDFKYHKISQFHKQTQTMFFIDWYQPTAQEFGTAFLSITLPKSIHHSGSNVGFLDGHVIFIKINDIPISNTDVFWTGF